MAENKHTQENQANQKHKNSCRQKEKIQNFMLIALFYWFQPDSIRWSRHICKSLNVINSCVMEPPSWPAKDVLCNSFSKAKGPNGNVCLMCRERFSPPFGFFSTENFHNRSFAVSCIHSSE